MVFPKNNLPTQSQPWTRDVEKRVENLESSFRSAEVNNVTRDSQALSQIRRLDAAVTSAQTAIDAVISLGSSGSTYDINADNITGGTITGVNFVTTGGTIKTELSGGKATFSQDNLPVGRITADTDGTNEFVLIESAAGLDGGGAYIIVGEDYTVMNSGSLGSVQTGLAGQDRVDITADNIYLNGSTSISGNLGVSGSFSPSSISTGSITGTSLDVGTGSIDGGYISGSTLDSSGSVFAASCSISSIAGGGLSITGNSDLQGRISSLGTYNATISSAANVFIASNGNLARSTSSRRYKTDIQDIDYGMKALDLRPRTWIDKGQYEQNGNSADGLPRIAGFIAEELDELGFTELVVYNDNGEPEAISYDRITVALIPVLKQQQAVIEQLTARIEALESRV